MMSSSLAESLKLRAERLLVNVCSQRVSSLRITFVIWSATDQRYQLGSSQAVLLRKEVIQPQVPLRLPCYDFTPVADLTVVGCLLKGWRTAFG